MSGQCRGQDSEVQRFENQDEWHILWLFVEGRGRQASADNANSSISDARRALLKRGYTVCEISDQFSWSENLYQEIGWELTNCWETCHLVDYKLTFAGQDKRRVNLE